jgi:DNA-binding IscR family transcriptional regulator
MTVEQIRYRLEEGSPLRLGELAKAAGYSREYVRKLANAGVLKASRGSRPGAHRRVPVDEAERFLRSEGLLS